MTGLRRLTIAGAMLIAVAVPSGALAAAGQHEVVTTAGPVVAYGVTPDLNCSASYAGDVSGEFFGDTACATVIAAPDALYAPAAIPAGSALTTQSVPFTPVSQSRSGAGTATSPFAITTTVEAGDLRLTQVDSYSTGSSRIRTVMTITNTGAGPVDFDLFRAGDCYAKDSDTGYGQMGPQSAACVSAVEARTVRFLATPLASSPQPEARTFQGFFYDLWSRIATFAPFGARQDFDGGCRCAENLDNSAGLQWRISLAPGQQSVIRSAIDFGPIATPGGFGAPIGTPPPGGRSYVALGDSFSSGEGAGDQGKTSGYGYLAGTDVRSGTAQNLCHRSANAYPLQIAARLGLDPAAEVDFRACSGAVIANLRGPNNPDKGREEAQLNALGVNTQLATLTIGGNDAHFADIVAACVKPDAIAAVGCDSAKAGQVSTDYRALSATSGPTSLVLAYQEILGRIGGNANLVVFGYPDFTPFGGGCQTADRFSPAESTWLSGWIRTFNSLIAERAAWAGATFVDVDRLYQPPNATSHRICSGDEWVNGLRELRLSSSNPAASESFHPNKLGQKAFADAFYRRFILGETNEALSGPSTVTFARESEITPAAAAAPVTVVIRKGAKAAVGLDVAAGRTTVASLRYDGAVPSLELLDPNGAPVPIGAFDPNAGLARTPGAATAALGSTIALTLRQMPPGRYTLNVQLPDAAPTDAGVLSARLTSLEEPNLAPVIAVTPRMVGARRVKVSAGGSIDPEGGRLRYRWTFGDGRTATKAATTHSFRRAGRYTVGVTAVDAQGTSATRKFVVDTRPQRIATLRLRRVGMTNRLRVALSCARAAVGHCETRLTVTTRARRGAPRVRRIDLSARARRTIIRTIELPGTAKRRFAGSVRASGVVTDEAVRPAPRTRAFSVLVAK